MKLKKIFMIFSIAFITHEILYAQRTQSMTKGKLDIIKLSSPDFNNGIERTIRIWTPEKYNSYNSIGVIYMQDGQNLFDNATAYAGEWYVDESLSTFMETNNEKYMVVGIDNGANRSNEYSPLWPNETTSTSKITNSFVLNPKGKTYLSFITDTVKPYIDKTYNTASDIEHTYIAGSSMGGVISLYCALEKPEIFKGAIVLSPALHVYKFSAIKKYLINKSKEYEINGIKRPRLYLYTGSLKGGSNGDEPWAENCIENVTKKLYKELKKNGWNEQNIILSINKNATHQEYFWAKEFPKAIEWMFSDNNN